MTMLLKLFILLILILIISIIKNNNIIFMITMIILIIIYPTVIITKIIIKYIINKRIISRKYLYKLSKYIYSTIHYEMNEVYEIYELHEMNRIYEIYELHEMNRIYEIKNKINDLHKTYYKYHSYSYVINNIEKELIILKKQDLTKRMISDINNQNILLTKSELQELILLKITGVKADMQNYKSYLKVFFKSLNDFNEIICFV
jgi:hypothetical protein